MDTEKILNNLIEYDYCDYPFDYFITEKLKDDTYMDDVFDMTSKQLIKTLKNKMRIGRDTDSISSSIKHALSVLTHPKDCYINSTHSTMAYNLSNIPKENEIMPSIKSSENFI